MYCSHFRCCFVHGCSKTTQIYYPWHLAYIGTAVLLTGDPAWTWRCHPCLVFTPTPVSNWQLVHWSHSITLLTGQSVSCLCDWSLQIPSSSLPCQGHKWHQPLPLQCRSNWQWPFFIQRRSLRAVSLHLSPQWNQGCAFDFVPACSVSSSSTP